MSRTERSGRYGSIIDRDDRDERESRSRRRDSDYKRSSDDRRGDRYDDYRDYDSPERERERRNSDRSEDGYHSDGDYGEHDYRHDISDERESKTIILRGLPITITENDIRETMQSFEGPQPADVRLMKRKTGESLLSSCHSGLFPIPTSVPKEHLDTPNLQAHEFRMKGLPWLRNVTLKTMLASERNFLKTLFLRAFFSFGK